MLRESFSLITIISRKEIRQKQPQAFFTMTNMIGSVFASALGGWLLDKIGVTLLLSASSVFAGAGTILMCYGVRKP